MWDVVDEVARWRSEGRQVAVARAVSFSGFGGRRAGEVLALDASGSPRAGELLGGSADSEVAAAAARLGPAAPAEVLDVSIGDPEAIAAGLACGGAARVLVQDVASLPALFWESIAARRPVALATAVGGGGDGAGGGVLAVGAGGATEGALEPPALREAVVEAAAQLLGKRREPSTTVEHGSASILVEAFVPATRLVILSEPVGLVSALGRQATLLGWESIAVEGAEEGLAAVAALGPQDAFVVLTHDHDLATPVLAAAVAGEAYVGALGSRHTQQVRQERLEAAGAGEEQRARVHGPVGLDLGARAPEETALAICAEILAVRSGRTAASLGTTTGPVNG
jgi:xanthine dehydrogenase accessory factor